MRLEHGIQWADSSIVSIDNHEQGRLESTDQNKTSIPKGPKQQKLSFEKNVKHLLPAVSQFEMNRDFAVWSSLDLLPFSFTESRGIKYFFGKNFPNVSLPSRYKLSRGGIYDVYDMVTRKLKIELKEVQMDGSAMSIMFDS